jgi:hypothetical protein
MILASPLLVGPSSLAAHAQQQPAAGSNDPEVGQLVDKFRLSQSEAEKRVADRPAREAWIAAIQAHPPTSFAGLRYDVASNVIHLYGKDLPAIRAAAQGAPVAIDETQVAFTQAELDAAEDEAARILFRTAPYPRPGELSIRDEAPEGRLYIDLGEAASPDTIQRANTFVAGHAGFTVVRDSPRAFGPVACGVASCNPPLRGGVANYVYESLTYTCTNGFNVTSRVDAKVYVLMAAHCQNGVPYTQRFATKFEDGSLHIIGSRWNGQYSGDVDAQIVTIDNPFGWQEQPYFLNGTATYQVNSIFQNTDFYIGMYLCHTGSKIGGTSCGYVNNLNGTYGDGLGHSVSNQVMTDACALGGDSGGPMYQINTVNMQQRAAGVVTVGRQNTTSCASPVTGFSRIESVTNALNVNVDMTYHYYS